MIFQYGDVLTHEDDPPLATSKVMFVALTDDCAKHGDGTPCLWGVDLTQPWDSLGFVECYVHDGWTKVEEK